MLETVFETDEGEVAVVDFRPPRFEAPELVRIVEGRRGCILMHLELAIGLITARSFHGFAVSNAGFRQSRVPTGSASERVSSFVAWVFHDGGFHLR